MSTSINTGMSTGMNIDKNIEVLEQEIDYVFQKKELVMEALTHSSFANERKIRKINCNERLEFLGDAVLEQAVSVYLFHHYPKMPEGRLTRLRAALVCEQALACAANEIHLGDYIFLGKGEEVNDGRNKPSVISDAMEALIGALYLDGGEEAVHAFIMTYILSNVEEREKAFVDHKSALQELVQAENMGVISYRIIGEYGPEHQKEFEVELKINEDKISVGRGRNKKAAEQAAAYEALTTLRTTDGE